jgi:hypothetical protein
MEAEKRILFLSFCPHLSAKVWIGLQVKGVKTGKKGRNMGAEI